MRISCLNLAIFALFSTPLYAQSVPPAVLNPTAAIPKSALSSDQTGLNSDGATLPTDDRAINGAVTAATTPKSPAEAMQDNVRASRARLDGANADLNYNLGHHTDTAMMQRSRQAVANAKQQYELDQRACIAAMKARVEKDTAAATLSCQ